MLDKLLKLYPNTQWFEIGDGHVSGTDRITFTTIFDQRFQGFPDGNIEKVGLKKIIESESFGLESIGFIWVENRYRELIKIRKSFLLNQKMAKKSSGKQTFQSDELAKAIRKIKITDANFLVFEGSKVKIKDFDGISIFDIDIPIQFEHEIRYDWQLVKRRIKLKKDSPKFSIVEIQGGVYSLWMHWHDCDIYVANHVTDYTHTSVIPTKE